MYIYKTTFLAAQTVLVLLLIILTLALLVLNVDCNLLPLIVVLSLVQLILHLVNLLLTLIVLGVMIVTVCLLLVVIIVCLLLIKVVIVVVIVIIVCLCIWVGRHCLVSAKMLWNIVASATVLLKLGAFLTLTIDGLLSFLKPSSIQLLLQFICLLIACIANALGIFLAWWFCWREAV